MCLNVITVQGSIGNIIGGPHDHLMSTRNFTMMIIIRCLYEFQIL